MSLLSIFGDVESIFTGKPVDTAQASVDLQKDWGAVLGIAQVAEVVTTDLGQPELALLITTTTALLSPLMALIEAGGVATPAQIVMGTSATQALFLLAVPHIKAVASTP